MWLGNPKPSPHPKHRTHTLKLWKLMCLELLAWVCISLLCRVFYYYYDSFSFLFVFFISFFCFFSFFLENILDFFGWTLSTLTANILHFPLMQESKVLEKFMHWSWSLSLVWLICWLFLWSWKPVIVYDFWTTCGIGNWAGLTWVRLSQAHLKTSLGYLFNILVGLGPIF